MKRWLFFILLTTSCNQKEKCTADAEFKRRFDENIQFLIWTQTDGDSTYQISDKIKTIYFLESVTGIESQIYWGDVFGYSDEKLLEEDIGKWKNWYDNNKCEIKITKVDSLYRNYRR